MGFNSGGANKKFATISDGKLVVSHKNEIPGITETRTNKNGKVVHEQKFKSFTGLVKSIKSKDTSFGKVWELEMQDGDSGEAVIVSWNYSSRYTNHFFRAIENVNLQEPVTLSPWSMKDKNDSSRTVIGLTMYQEGQGFEKDKVPFKYTKENPGKMPELQQTKRKGKTEWDDSDQLEFFEQIASNLFEQETADEAPF